MAGILLLETPRLIMRPFNERDIPVFSAYRSDPNVARYQGWNAPYSLDLAAAFVAGMQTAQPGTPGEWYQLAIEVKASGEMIGDGAFHLLKEDIRQAEIGLTLARSAQGQGYAVEVTRRLLDYLLGELGLHRVKATCDALNLAAARTLERAGMRREAYFVEHLWFKGAWSSEYVYAILGREWMAACNASAMKLPN